MGNYIYDCCRRAYAGPGHDRCPTHYVRAGALENVVVRERTAMPASLEVVMDDREHAS